MKVIERLTAAEIQLRAPPRISSPPWNGALQLQHSARFRALRSSPPSRRRDLLVQHLQPRFSRSFVAV